MVEPPWNDVRVMFALRGDAKITPIMNAVVAFLFSHPEFKDQISHVAWPPEA